MTVPKEILGFPVLHPGVIVELFGPAGAGKTQLAFSLAAKNQFFLVFWLDTEGTFRSERLTQMGATGDTLERLRVRQIRDERSLFESLAMIKSLLPADRRSECLVVVDSVTAAFKKTSEATEKARTLHQLALTLKALNCCVLVTNQVRAEIGKSADFHAALGATWSHGINFRILVVRENGQRVLRFIKSPMDRFANIQTKFLVTSEGCEISGNVC